MWDANDDGVCAADKHWQTVAVVSCLTQSCRYLELLILAVQETDVHPQQSNNSACGALHASAAAVTADSIAETAARSRAAGAGTP
jgi:hypothetical protein